MGDIHKHYSQALTCQNNTLQNITEAICRYGYKHCSSSSLQNKLPHMGIISYACCPNLLSDSGNYKNDLGKMCNIWLFFDTTGEKNTRHIEGKKCGSSLKKTLP